MDRETERKVFDFKLFLQDDFINQDLFNEQYFNKVRLLGSSNIFKAYFDA